jgi:hypothetical protein
MRVNALALLSNGDLVAGCGYKYSANGPVVQGGKVTRWTGAAWVALDPQPSNLIVNTLALSPTGELISGVGTNVYGTDPDSSRLNGWDGTSWRALTHVTHLNVNGEILALDTFPNGDVVAGGRFLGIENVLANRIARRNGSTWVGLGTGMNNPVILWRAARSPPRMASRSRQSVSRVGTGVRGRRSGTGRGTQAPSRRFG